jgi:hypothetical protein
MDGLEVTWASRTFVNPPSSKTGLWVEKAHKEWKKGKLVVMLINAVTDTEYFHKFIYQKDGVEIRFHKGRVRFFRDGVEQGPHPRPSMIVIFRPQPAQPEVKEENDILASVPRSILNELLDIERTMEDSEDAISLPSTLYHAISEQVESMVRQQLRYVMQTHYGGSTNVELLVNLEETCSCCYHHFLMLTRIDDVIKKSEQGRCRKQARGGGAEEKKGGM